MRTYLTYQTFIPMVQLHTRPLSLYPIVLSYSQKTLVTSKNSQYLDNVINASTTCGDPMPVFGRASNAPDRLRMTVWG